MNTVFVDIETIPGQDPAVIGQLYQEAAEEKAKIKAPSNYKDDAKIAEYIQQRQDEIDASIQEKWRKTSFDGAMGQIVAISLAFDDEAPINIYREDWQAGEREILEEAYALIEKKCSPTKGLPAFVGHNVHGFDLRFMYQRGVLLGVKSPLCIPFRAKPWDGQIFDTMLEWAGHGKTISLDKLCRVMGIPTKGTEIGDEIDGSKVWDFVLAGRISDVALYCGGDVERVREIYRRMTHQAAYDSSLYVNPDAAPQAPKTPMPADPGARITLGHLGARLSPLSVTRDGLAQLGFEPAGKERAAVLYRLSDLPAIRDALITRLRGMDLTEHREAA